MRAQVLVEAKPIWKSRTFWFNLLAALAAVLTSVQEAAASPLLTLPDWSTGAIVLVVAVVNAVLRALTSQPVTLSRTSGIGAVPAPGP